MHATTKRLWTAQPQAAPFSFQEGFEMRAMNFGIALVLVAGSAAASPCSVGVTAQPEMPAFGVPVSIHYGAEYRGFLGEPAVVIAGTQITIDQLTAVADPVQAGVIPCGEKVVAVGVLSSGVYQVTVRMGFLGSMTGSFVVPPARASICAFVVDANDAPSTGPASGTTAVSVSTDHNSVLLHFENRGFAESVGEGASGGPVLGVPVIQTSGNRIMVSQTYVLPMTSELPPYRVYGRFCQAEDIDLGALAHGTYTLIWTYATPTGPVPVTMPFSYGSEGRRRAAGRG